MNLEAFDFIHNELNDEDTYNILHANEKSFRSKSRKANSKHLRKLKRQALDILKQWDSAGINSVVLKRIVDQKSSYLINKYSLKSEPVGNLISSDVANSLHEPINSWTSEVL